MSKEFSNGSVVTRSQRNLRKHPAVTELIKKGRGNLTDHSGRHTVEVQWHLNEAADRDHIFKLIIDDKVVYLDLEELTYHTRIMFAK